MTRNSLGVLFDLDGTLLDTAPEFTYLLNILRDQEGLSPIDLALIRPIAALGSSKMVQTAFSINDDDPKFMPLREQFLSLYGSSSIGSKTILFPGMEQVLHTLDQKQFPWGIVTNKLSGFAAALVKKFPELRHARCIIGGDSFGISKPNPLPLLKACESLQIPSSKCWYIGDAKSDVEASHQAGMPCVIVNYGYLPLGEDPLNWKANHYVNTPQEILELLSLHS